MPYLNKTGLVVCLSVSALVAACSDDDGGDSEQPRDSSVADAGPRDATISIDGSLDASFDAATRDASGDSSIPKTDYVVSLTSAAEVPACTMAGSSAQGQATVKISAAGTEIDVTVTYSGLSGAPAMGHIHYGAAGAMGPVVLPFTGDLSSGFTQKLTSATYKAPATGPATFADFIGELRAGKAYVNLHTAACGSGEIRGQIQ